MSAEELVTQVLWQIVGGAIGIGLGVLIAKLRGWW